MILLLGATGYVGSAFARMLTARGVPYRPLSRRDVDYTRFDALAEVLDQTRPRFLINCAGYTGKPNVDACEVHKAECLDGNAVLPGTIRRACEQTGTPWGHVSSGCIYTGTREDGSGFRETDSPNFCFRTDNCSFYSGCKALGEECLEGAENCFVWRLRIPFDSNDGPRNYLSKLIHYDRLLSVTNSISQLDEFTQACYETWEKRIPFGTYNVTNTGSVTTERVTELINQELGLNKQFKFYESEAAFMNVAAKTPRSSCVLDNTKLTSAGIHISHVEDAIIHTLRNWKKVASC